MNMSSSQNSSTHSAPRRVFQEEIFCVPGNHDIDRQRQTLCFHGARTLFKDQNRIDAVLGTGEELETLGLRQE